MTIELSKDQLIEAARQVGNAGNPYSTDCSHERTVETPETHGHWMVRCGTCQWSVGPIADGDVVIRALILMALRGG